MSQLSLFRWRGGAGWLVLSGGGDPETNQPLDIDAAVLSRTISLNPLAFVWSAGDIESADRYMDYLDDIGGRTGYLVDVIAEDDESLKQQLEEAGIIILGDGPQAQRLRNGLNGPALEAISTAYASGATVYAIGQAAGILAEHFALPGENLRNGLGWLEDAVVASGYEDARADLQHHLQTMPDAYGIALGTGAAIALSPEGTVEIWGQPNVTVLLGKNRANG
jgi:hypothetical protein